MEPFWIVLDGYGSAIRFWNVPHKNQINILTLNFRMFDVGQEMNNDWVLVSSGIETNPLSEWEKVDWEIDGFIKWDGCINWQTNPNYMIHGCGPEHIALVNDFLTVVYGMAKEMMPSFNKEKVPDFPSCMLRLTT